jgi:hypothetical protein
VPANTSGLKRGGSRGRPKGVPNKATVEAKAACAALVDDPEYREALAKRLRAGKLSPAMECMLWHYAKGKPREYVEQTSLVVYRWGETRPKRGTERPRQDGADLAGSPALAPTKP